MSIEFYAALNKVDLPDASGVNEVSRAMGIPLEVGPSFIDLSISGFRPAQFAGHESGVEADLSPIESIAGVYQTFDADTADRYDSVLTFTFGSDAREGAVAMGICAVLTRAADALIYSTEDGRFVEQAELIGWMNELAASAQKSEGRR